MKNDALSLIRDNKPINFKQQCILIMSLSLPAIMAQLSSTVMQYFDAAMVGKLGAEGSAAVGLVSSSTWLFEGVCVSVILGFTVQVAHRIGAKQERVARDIMKLGLLISVALGVVLGLLGAVVSMKLPVFLGGKGEVARMAGNYFFVFAVSLPFAQLNSLSGGMLQSSGDMKTPSILNIIMCVLNVVFNFLLIYPTRVWHGIKIYGAGLGVTGASLGTTLSKVVISLIMTYILLYRSPMLRLRKGERYVHNREYLKTGIKIAIPAAIERFISGTAYVAYTAIVAPLGNIAVAANSFAITAESFCYMPGYGIGAAASTIIGQSIGAKRRDLTRKLAWITTVFGMAVMTFMGVLLFITAPYVMRLLTSNKEIIELGTQILRIEAFAEPFYAASIVATGVFRGAGDTVSPSLLNLISMWAVRIPAAVLLAPRFGLHGAWIAMSGELCVRGIIFLLRMCSKKWSNKSLV